MREQYATADALAKDQVCFVLLNEVSYVKSIRNI
jgi:hypothetical protein